MEHVLQNEYYKATKCLTCSNCGKTIKMAEEFLECFRDLIEKAGDLI